MLQQYFILNIQAPLNKIMVSFSFLTLNMINAVLEASNTNPSERFKIMTFGTTHINLKIIGYRSIN